MRHHYVPQFLLRQWRAQIDEKVEVFRLDFPHLPSKRHAPQFTGYEYDLYALTRSQVTGMEQQAVEKHLLRHIDNYAARVLKKFLSNGFRKITQRDRCDWARFIMSLRLRQPSIVNMIREESSQHLTQALSANPEEWIAPGDEPSETLIDWTERNYPGLIENFGMSFFHKLVDNPEVGRKMLQMKWWLWDFSSQKQDLLLADHPCIFTAGIDDPCLVIAVPLGPRKAFMATASDRVAQIMGRQSPRNLVVRMNESTVAQAQTRIYASNTTPRRFIENRIKAQVDLD